MSSVGTPEFDFDTAGAEPELEPVEPAASASLAPKLALALLAGAIAVLFVLAGDREAETPAPPASSAPVTTERPVDALLGSQQRAGARYWTRPVGGESVFVATADPDGFFGLRRGAGGWVPVRSTDGIDWTVDGSEPITGIPEAFRPGARRWGPEALQFVDRTYWGRFVSPRLAGSSGAMLLMRSSDGTTWEQIERPLPDSLDSAELGGVRFDDPADFAVVGQWVSTSAAPGGFPNELLFSLGDSDDLVFEVVDVSANRHGAAVLLYDEESLTFRVVVTRDGERWDAVALAESGALAVEIVVVGADDVLLRWGDGMTTPLELVVPLPDPRRAPPFEMALIDLVVSQATAFDGGYVGFIAAAGDPDRLAVVGSEEGLLWSRRGAQPTVGLPPESNPVGQWAGSGSGLLAAFTDPTGRTLFFARSADGVNWEVGPTYSSARQVRPGVVAASDVGVLYSVEERSSDGRTLDLRHFWASPDLSDVRPLDLGDGERVRLARPSETGVLAVVVGPDSLAPPGANHEIRFTAGNGWIPIDVPEVVAADVRELGQFEGDVVAVTSVASYVVAPDAGGASIRLPVGSIGSDRSGSVVVVDVRAGPGGAAALLFDERSGTGGAYTLAMTSDYRTWDEIWLSGEVVNIIIRDVGEDEVILEGFGVGAGPQRLRVELPG